MYRTIGGTSKVNKELLLGTWQILSFRATAGNKISYPLGERPSGYVGFSHSRFWVMLVDSSRKAPSAAALTNAEAIILMNSSAAYTGKYDVDPAQTPDGIKITIHVDTASNQAIVGTDRVFYMGVEGNKLTLKSPAMVVATSGSTSIVQLEFVKAD
jgi:hypothetical protein